MLQLSVCLILSLLTLRGVGDLSESDSSSVASVKIAQLTMVLAVRHNDGPPCHAFVTKWETPSKITSTGVYDHQSYSLSPMWLGDSLSCLAFRAFLFVIKLLEQT